MIKAKVIEIISNPYSAYGRWFVKVRYTSPNGDGIAELMFDSLRDAESISMDYTIPI